MREHGGVSPPLEMLRGPLLPPGTDFRLLQEARPARHPGAGQPQGQVRRGKHSPGTFTTDPAWWQPDRLRGAVRVRARLQLRWRGRPLCPGARVRHGRPRAPDRGPGNSSLQPGHRSPWPRPDQVGGVSSLRLGPSLIKNRQRLPCVCPSKSGRSQQCFTVRCNKRRR